MTVQIFVESHDGKTKALTQSQFKIAHDIIIEMMNGEMRAKQANVKIIEICENLGDPIIFDPLQ